jgi:hypothetical protein
VRSKGFKETCRKMEIQEFKVFLFCCMRLFRDDSVHKCIVYLIKA